MAIHYRILLLYCILRTLKAVINLLIQHVFSISQIEINSIVGLGPFSHVVVVVSFYAFLPLLTLHVSTFLQTRGHLLHKINVRRTCV